MAFNLGAFAGGLAKGGMDTYQTLEAIESQKKRDALVELQTKEAEQAMKGREALRSAIAEQGDMNTVNPAQMMAGPAPQGLPQEGGYMTPEVQASEKLARVRQRALEGGADPTAVMQYANAQRADTSAFNTEKAFEWMRKSDQVVADKGLRAAAEEYLLPHYNANKGTLNDGLTAKIVDTKNGPVVQFSDSKGNIQNDRTRQLTMDTFRLARDEVGASMLAAAGPEHFYKTQELGLKKQTLGLQREELNAKKPLYAAQANQANAHASVYGNMLQTAKDSKEAGKAMQPFLDEFAQMTPEEQAGSKGQAVLLKGATAGAQKSKDLAGIVTMLRKPDRAAVSAEQEKAAYTAYNEATTPEQIKAVKAKYPDVFGKSALDKAIEAREKSGGGSATTPVVEGRPLYNKSMSELQSMAKKPRGVSTAEANDAQAELEARKGEPRMSALPSN